MLRNTKITSEMHYNLSKLKHNQRKAQVRAHFDSRPKKKSAW